MAIFRVPLQSRVIEDANRYLRDHETRESSSNELSHFNEWNLVVASKLLETYEFRQVELANVASTDPKFNAGLFAPVHASNGEKDSADLYGILAAKAWPSFTAQSLKHTVSNLYFFKFLHQTNQWAQADGAWAVQMLPEGHILIDKPRALQFLVVKVLHNAALVWPVIKASPTEHIYELDLQTKALDWYVTLSIDDLLVVPAAPLSPVHCHIRKLTGRSNFVFESARDPLALIDFHAGRGFLGIEEGVLRALCRSEGMMAIEDTASPDLPVSDQMVLELCLAMVPGLTKEAAHALLVRRNLKSDLNTLSYCDFWDEEAVDDVILLGDSRATKDFLKERKNAVKKVETTKANVTKLMSLRFDHSAAAAPANRKARTTKKAADKVAQDRAAMKTRFRADMEKDALKAMYKYLPPVGGVCTDTSNGRFQLRYPHLGRVSLSWTLRGQDSAIDQTLRQMWTWHNLAFSPFCTVGVCTFRPVQVLWVIRGGALVWELGTK